MHNPKLEKLATHSKREKNIPMLSLNLAIEFKNSLENFQNSKSRN